MALMDINWRPDRSQLRTFAVLWLVAFTILGFVVAWRTGLLTGTAGAGASWRAPIAVWIVAAVVSAAGIAYPEAIRPVYVAWMAVSFPIGWVVGHVMLGLTYFGLFTVVAAVFRLIGRDALTRRFDRGASTYWIKRPAPRKAGDYFKQF
jgi:hypothetical protein